jgi:hypothetical protein
MFRTTLTTQDTKRIDIRHLRVRAPDYIKHTNGYTFDLPNQFEALITYGSHLNSVLEPPMINETIDIRASDIKWPLELEQDIFQVDDPAWGLKEDNWR